MISDLPSSITEHILTCLPLRDAVRTSILSRQWRYKWATLPNLEFHHYICPQRLEVKKLKAIIYQVLLIHIGSIFKFSLSSFELESCSDINRWILFLSKNTIQEFTLCLDLTTTKHALSSHLFSFVHLKRLNLSNCEFMPPCTFKGFSKLDDLELALVVLVPEMFGSFVSNCPLLERLKLDLCTDFDCLEINAPSLKKFLFCGIFKSVCFQNTSLLAEISINLVSVDLNMEWYHEQGTKHNLIKFLYCLPAIEKMTVCPNFLEFLAVGGVPERLPSSLNYLKSPHFLDIRGGKIDEVSCAFSLIRSSPNLQKLNIHEYTISETSTFMEHAVGFFRAQDFTNCCLNKLRKVKVGLESTSLVPGLELIKLLLACSTVLEKMKIYLLGADEGDAESKMFKKVIQYPRASPKAEITCLDLND